MVIVHRATREARGLSRSALPTPATRRRRGDVVWRARPAAISRAQVPRARSRRHARAAARDADVGSGFARRLVREPDPEGGRRRRLAFATYGKGRVPGARRSCSCIILSALRPGSRDRGGVTDRTRSPERSPTSPAPTTSPSAPGRTSPGYSCATMSSPASCSPTAMRSRRRSSSRLPIPRARCSAWSIRCGSIRNSFTPCATSSSAAARRSCVLPSTVCRTFQASMIRRPCSPAR